MSKEKIWKPSKRVKAIQSKTYQSYTKDDILNSTWDSIMRLDDKSLYNLTKKAVKIANTNRANLLNYLMINNLPLPPSLKTWKKSTSTLNEFDITNTGVSNVRSYLGKNYEYGYATIDFNINHSMSRNELFHKLRVVSEFLDNRASNIEQYVEYMNETVERIVDKSKLKDKIKFTDFSKEQYEAIWRAYNRLEGSKVLDNYGGSEEIQQLLFETAYRQSIYSVDDLVDYIDRVTDIEYEERVTEDGEIDDGL